MTTPRQMDALRFIAGYQETNGYSPGFRQIAVGVGYSVKSLSATSDLLDELEARGKIRRLPNRKRAIEVLHAPAIPRAPDGAPLYLVRLAA